MKQFNDKNAVVKINNSINSDVEEEEEDVLRDANIWHEYNKDNSTTSLERSLLVD